MVKEIYKELRKNNCKIITPVDFALSDNINGDASFKDVKNVTNNKMILDIGPKTIVE